MSAPPLTTLGLNLPVFATWISPYTFYLVYLSSNVSALRRKYLTPVGEFINPVKKSDDNTSKPQFDAKNPDPLFIAVRCHANYVEVIPWCLGLAALAELNGGDKTVLNVALGVLFASRVAHVAGMKGKFAAGLGRKVGAAASLLYLVGMAGYNTWLCKGWWGL